MKTRSRKNKGKRLQKEVQKLLLEKTHKLGLVDGDIRNAIMGESGVDIKLSPAAEKIIPFDIECKNQEHINIWGAIDQAETNTKDGRMSLIVFKKNRTETYCALKFEDLMKLLYPES